MTTTRATLPRLLILETSSRVGRVGLALGHDLGPERTLEASRRHARDLAPALVDLCRERDWRIRELDGIIINRGPGSYTGLRVGLMTAKTLAYATGAVLLAIDAHAAIAQLAPPEATKLDVVIDAQQRLLYTQRFERHDGQWRSTRELAIQSFIEWQTQLAADIWVSGPGVALVEDTLPESQPRVPLAGREATLQSLLQLGLVRWHAGAGDDYRSVEPLYLRPSNAEVNWERRAGKT